MDTCHGLTKASDDNRDIPQDAHYESNKREDKSNLNSN